MQECGDDPLLIDPSFRREIERVDAVERRVRGVADQRLDGGDDIRVGRLAKHRKQGLGLTELDLIHGESLRENGCTVRGSCAEHELVCNRMRGWIGTRYNAADHPRGEFSIPSSEVGAEVLRNRMCSESLPIVSVGTTSHPNRRLHLGADQHV